VVRRRTWRGALGIGGVHERDAGRNQHGDCCRRLESDSRSAAAAVTRSAGSELEVSDSRAPPLAKPVLRQRRWVSPYPPSGPGSCRAEFSPTAVRPAGGFVNAFKSMT
jgi:hypothetical protein